MSDIRKKIINMAKEAGFQVGPATDRHNEVWGVGANLNRFYHMAQTEERKKFFHHAVDFAIRAANEEREECAKVCEQAGIDGHGTLAAAALIRARGQARVG